MNGVKVKAKIKQPIKQHVVREYHKGRYEKAYNTIKEALLNKKPFVEIEI